MKTEKFKFKVGELIRWHYLPDNKNIIGIVLAQELYLLYEFYDIYWFQLALKESVRETFVEKL